MVIYLDVLFGANALMDGVTLLAAARLAGAAVHRGRFVLACLLGGAYAVLAALFPALGVLPVRAAMGAALCLAAFGGERTLLRLGGLYFVTAAAFAGLAYALGAASGRRLLYGAGYYFTVPLGLLLLAAAVGYAVSGVLLRGDAAHGCVRQEILPLTVQFGGRERRVRVLRDSGHTLTEPVSGKPVLILCRGEAALLLNDPLDGDAAQQLTSRPAALPRGRDRPRSAAVLSPGLRAGGGRKHVRLRMRRRAFAVRKRTIRWTYQRMKGRKA